MDFKKFVILSTSIGDDQDRLAEGLRLWIRKLYPDSKIVHIDATKYMSVFLRRKYTDSYTNIVKKHPALWGYMYDKMDHAKKHTKFPDLGFTLQDIFSQKLTKKIKELRPDYIICTHYLPAEQLNRHKGEKLASKYGVIITDFDVHWLWIQRNMDMFFVSTEESAQRLVARGISKDKVSVTGIPVNPVYSEKYSRKDIRTELGLNPENRTVLLLSGGYGVGSVPYLCGLLLEKFPKNVQIIALAEKDEKHYQKLNELSENYPKRFIFRKVTKRIEKLMAASDIVITKAGGFISSACLTLGLPIITINPIPGKEERNADFLVENNVAYKAYDEVGLLYKLNLLLTNKSHLEQMRMSALKIAKPDAGRKVLETLVASASSHK